MSKEFRQTLADDIRDKVAARASGHYFNYGSVKLKRERWDGELSNRLRNLIQSGGGQVFSDVPAVFEDFEKIGNKLRKHLRTKKGTFTLIDNKSKVTNEVIELHYKRAKRSEGNTRNIENSFVRACKDFLKKEITAIAIEYVHGRSGTGQFDIGLFRGNESDVRQALAQGESMPLGQGINVDQAIAQAIDEVVLSNTNYYVFSTIVEKYSQSFGYEHKVDKSRGRQKFKDTFVMQGFLDPKDLADNRADYDSALLEDMVEFLEETDTKAAVEIMKRLKKANANDWKGIGPAAMGNLWRESPSLADSLDKAGKTLILETMLKNIKINPDFRLKVNKQLLKQGLKERKSSKGTLAKSKTKRGYKSKEKRDAGARVVATSKVQQKAGANPMALKNLLNEILPMTVAQNMTSPALNFRTGRFANSVRVDNITQGPRGGNTMIEATYMTNPYETFAPGGQKYTPQRDPERLIKRSIRQVASGIIGAKFGINIQ